SEQRGKVLGAEFRGELSRLLLAAGGEPGLVAVALGQAADVPGALSVPDQPQGAGFGSGGSGGSGLVIATDHVILLTLGSLAGSWAVPGHGAASHGRQECRRFVKDQ